MAVEANFLGGNVVNSGSVDVANFLTSTMSAKATAPNGSASATASNFGIAEALGVIAEFGFHDGATTNSGAIDVVAAAKLSSTAFADTLGGEGGEARASDLAQAQVRAGGLTEGTGFSEGVTNSGAISVGGAALVDVNVTATGNSAVGVAGRIAGEGGANGASAIVLGIGASAGSFAGGVSNSGAIDAIGSALAASKVVANATTGVAFAEVHNAADAVVAGMAINFGTMDGEIVNKGPITALGVGSNAAFASASGVTAANAAAFATGRPQIAPTSAPAQVVVDGVSVSGGVLNGNFKNSGAIDVESVASAHGTAIAHSGDTESRQALASASYTAEAAGIAINAGTFVGSLTNTGTLIVSATALAAAEAKATGGTPAASAFATDPIAGAVGFGVNVGTLAGSVTNKGAITATAVVTGLAKATANGSGLGTASAVGEAAATGSAYAISISGGTMTGNISNSGALSASAAARASATASAKGAAAIADASAGQGSPGFVSASAYGIFANFATLNGNLADSGAIDAHAQVTALAKALASGTAGNATAHAHASGSEASAFGIALETIQIAGNVSNTAAIEATALSKTSASAIAVSSDDASAAVDAHTTSEAFAILVTADVLDGNVLNKGDLLAVATGSVTGTAKATGATSGQASDQVEGSADAFGIDLNVTTLNGSVSNSGAITAQARILAKASAAANATTNAQATSVLSDVSATADGIRVSGLSAAGTIANSGAIDVFAQAKGTGKAVAQGQTATALAEGDAFATAAGIRVDSFLHTGALGNSGALSVTALASALVDATATGDPAKASALASEDGGIFAEARGIASQSFSHVGDVNNSGSIDVLAAANLTASANAQASGGVASALAAGSDHGAGAFAAGINASNFGFDGNVTNTGSISVGASVSEKMTAIASSTANDALASAIASHAEGFAAGIDISVFSVNGNVANSGNIDVISSDLSNASAKAVAPAAGATANAAATVTNEAFGIEVSAFTAVGDIANTGSHTVTVGALSTGKAIATATGADAVANATVASANALADGILVSSFGFTGDVDNTGAIVAVAKAVGSSLANAKGTATSAAAAEGFAVASANGIAVSQFSALGDISSSGSIVAHATVTANATANATGGAEQETASAFGSAQANGILLSAESAAGDLDNSGSIEAQALSKVKAAGSAAAATASAFAAGINYEVPFGTGNVVNSGSILAVASAQASSNQLAEANAFAAGIELNVTTFNGSVVNSGTMIAVAKAAAVGATASSSASANGIFAQFSTITGDIDNSGTIVVQAFADPARAVGINLAGGGGERGDPGVVVPALLPGPTGTGTLFGDVNNSGVISVFASGLTARATGIRLDGTSVTGAINNTGLIIAAATGLDVQANAINVEKAIGPTVINQLDGGMVGDIRMSNGFGDTFNWSGGFIDGNFFGGFKATGDADVLNVFAGVDKAFDYSGNIDGLSVININTTLSAGHHVDFSFGGIVTNTGTLNVNDNGRLLLHPDAIVNVDNYNNAAGGTVGFELTPSTNPADYAHINVAKTANLDGTISADYRAGLYANTQTYEDVIVAGAQVGSFASVVDNSALLDTTVRYDGAFTVDLITKRRPGGFCGISGKTGNQSRCAGR